MIDFIWVIGVVVLLFGAAIFVHEFGHYWVALKRGLKVEEFAIGFGPILWSREKDGILYSIRAIPAGGFVKLPQMLTSEAIEGKPKDEEEDAPEDEEEVEELPPVSPLSKILVAFAGPLMNVVFAFVIAFILWGVGVLKPASSTVVGYVESSEGNYTKIKPGDKIVEVDGTKVASWQKITFSLIRHEGQKVPVILERTVNGTTQNIAVNLKADKQGQRIKGLYLSPEQELVISIDKKEENVSKEKNKGYLSDVGFKDGDKVLLVDDHPVYGQRHLIDLLMANANKKTITVENESKKRTLMFSPAENTAAVKVHTVPVPTLGSWDSFWVWTGLKEEELVPPTPAIQAGLKKGDLILKLNDTRVTSARHIVDLISKNGEKETRLQILRGQKYLIKTVKPTINPEAGRAQIGFIPEDNAGIKFSPLKPTYRPAVPTPNPWEQVMDVWDMITLTVGALTRSQETGVGAKDLSGPVGIFGMLSIQVKTDYRLALSFLVLLNINLAILNLLPVPVLDGGHILMSIIEKIRNKPISVRVQEYATTVFAVMLLSFMLYVTFFDIKERVPIFRELFGREATIQEKPPSK